MWIISVSYSGLNIVGFPHFLLIFVNFVGKSIFKPFIIIL